MSSKFFSVHLAMIELRYNINSIIVAFNEFAHSKFCYRMSKLNVSRLLGRNRLNKLIKFFFL